MTDTPLEVVPTAAFGEHVASLLADRLADRPDLVVALPTGSTPLPVYAALPGVLARRGVVAGSAMVVVLDEFVGLPAGHRARCDDVLQRTLLSRLDPSPGFVTFDVDGLSGEAACEAVEAAVAAVGGLDLVVLGLGVNGHIGMNEPGSTVDSPTRVVELAPSTREASIGYGATEPPTHGVTLGMTGILAAREIWLLATGAHKAAILSAVLDGPITPAVPASLLRGHLCLRIIADEAAAH